MRHLVLILTVLFFVACVKNGDRGARGPQGVPGINGTNGRDGVDAILEIIDPCGDGPGEDEIILRLSSGEVLAWYKNLGLADLDPGHYVTTDKQRCLFEVTSDGIVREL